MEEVLLAGTTKFKLDLPLSLLDVLQNLHTNVDKMYISGMTSQDVTVNMVVQSGNQGNCQLHMEGEGGLITMQGDTMMLGLQCVYTPVVMEMTPATLNEVRSPSSVTPKQEDTLLLCHTEGNTSAQDADTLSSLPDAITQALQLSGLPSDLPSIPAAIAEDHGNYISPVSAHKAEVATSDVLVRAADEDDADVMWENVPDDPSSMTPDASTPVVPPPEVSSAVCVPPAKPLLEPVTPLETPATPLQEPVTPLQDSIPHLETPATPMQETVTPLQGSAMPMIETSATLCGGASQMVITDAATIVVLQGLADAVVQQEDITNMARSPKECSTVAKTQQDYPLQCPFCPKRFLRPQGALSHVKLYHQGEPGIGDAMSHLQDLKFEQSSRKSRVEVVCPICRKTYKGMTVLKHLDLVHFWVPNLQHVKTQCKDQVQAAIRDLTNRNTICHLCGMSLMRRDLKRHWARRCKGKKHLEDNPGADLTQVYSELNAKWCECAICHKKLANPDVLKLHLQKFHKTDPKLSEALNKVVELRLQKHKHKSVLRIECPQCRGVYHGRNVVTHVKVAHSDLENLNDLEMEAEKRYQEAKKAFGAAKKTCPHCGKEMCHKALLCHLKYWCKAKPDGLLERPSTQRKNSTKATSAENTSAKPKLTCNKCDKSFSRSFTLNRHMLIHKGVYDVKCPACDKTFVDKRNMDIHHQRIHLKQFPFSCKKCGKNFMQQQRFKSHRCQSKVNSRSSDSQSHYAVDFDALEEKPKEQTVGRLDSVLALQQGSDPSLCAQSGENEMTLAISQDEGNNTPKSECTPYDLRKGGEVDTVIAKTLELTEVNT